MSGGGWISIVTVVCTAGNIASVAFYAYWCIRAERSRRELIKSNDSVEASNKSIGASNARVLAAFDEERRRFDEHFRQHPPRPLGSA